MTIVSAADIAKITIGVVISLVIVFTLLVAVSNQPTHDDLSARQTMMEEQLRYISCILLIPPDDRVPEAVAACPVRPEIGE